MGRVDDLVLQWRAKDAASAQAIRFGGSGLVELRCIYRDWPVKAPVEVHLPAGATGVSVELEVDGHVRVTLSTGETVRVPCPSPSLKLDSLHG